MQSGVVARRVGEVCCMRIGRMVKSGDGRGRMMRSKGGHTLVLVARADITAAVGTLAALRDAMQVLSAVFVTRSRACVSRCGRWRRGRGEGLALGDRDGCHGHAGTGSPWVGGMGTVGICGGEERVSMTLLDIVVGSGSRDGIMEGSKYGVGEAHVKGPGVCQCSGRDWREQSWTHNGLPMGWLSDLKLVGNPLDPQAQTTYPTASAPPRGW
jgi:hypothetical protein